MKPKTMQYLQKKIEYPSWILIGQCENMETIENLKKEVLTKVKTSKLNYKTNVQGLFTGFNTLVGNIDFHNFWNEIQTEIKIATQEIPFSLHDAWGNVLKKNEFVESHSHKGINGFSGILYLTENGPGTYFSQYDKTIEEKIGRFVLFEPFLQHEVKKVENEIERVSIAFNCRYLNKWESTEEYINIKK